jgi:hypothetical protein
VIVEKSKRPTRRTSRRLRVGGVVQERVERRFVDRPEQGLRRAVGFDDDERRLRGHLEAQVHVARIVADGWERQVVLVDEVLERPLVTRPGDADEVDGSRPTFACRFDRSGFTVADASSGRPEPEHDRTFGVFVPIEDTASDQRRAEIQRRWGGRPVVDGRRRTGVSLWCGVRTSGEQPGERDRGDRNEAPPPGCVHGGHARSTGWATHGAPLKFSKRFELGGPSRAVGAPIYMASTRGMISSFSRLRSSRVFDTGTSANGGQRSGIVSPASW